MTTSAAAWTGLLDRVALAWDAPLLAHLGLPAETLSPLVDVSEPLHGLVEPLARRWPTLSAVPWFRAIGDGAAANVGSGCVGAERVALTLGTTGALRMALDTVATVPSGLWCYRVDRRYALVGGATSEGGNVYAWLNQTLRLGDPEAVEREIAAFPPDGHGLTVLPSWPESAARLGRRCVGHGAWADTGDAAARDPARGSQFCRRIGSP